MGELKAAVCVLQGEVSRLKGLRPDPALLLARKQNLPAIQAHGHVLAARVIDEPPTCSPREQASRVDLGGAVEVDHRQATSRRGELALKRLLERGGHDIATRREDDLGWPRRARPAVSKE